MGYVLFDWRCASVCHTFRQEFYDEGVRLYKPLAIEAEGGITSTWDLNYVTLGWAEV
jgi:hypothetical protein